MRAANLVIVESPAKARTIEKYLGGDFRVVASYGHVRDLPPKDGSVLPDEDFRMHWSVDEQGKKRVNELARNAREAAQIYLATDPDREGEAISWHICEELSRRKILGDKPVRRVVFNEITKSAVLDAIAAPREIDRELIDAYLARRALDYLVGFTLSPVLWRKLPGARSAGRVQSVALRLVCEREAEIELFRSREYWQVNARLENMQGVSYPARLTHLHGRKLDKFDLADAAAAESAAQQIRDSSLHIARLVEKQAKRHPAPPFTTSTLQQEASRKLHFGTAKTMRIAQKLYEGASIGGESAGLITYMRTDSTSLSGEAVSAARALIAQRFGADYLPDRPRIYKTKAKNAQEAHEAVRPTDMARLPEQVQPWLDQDGFRLYELIWKRAVASQMQSAILDQVAVDIGDGAGQVTLRATGSVIRFPGFLTLYREDTDDPGEDDGEGKILPPLTQGEPARQGEVVPSQHFTQPPPRYSEAGLVKRMEELGIGRPSTYASILKVLQDRNYVRLDKRRFIPEDRGRLVSAFLSHFFDRYFAYDFTAAMEEKLDDISGGRRKWKEVLREFWSAFSPVTDAAMELSPVAVRETVDRILGPHFFQPDENGSDVAARACPACAGGRLALNFGKFGAFIACSNYPECAYTRNLGEGSGDSDGDAPVARIDDLPRHLGIDPQSGKDVTLRKGPYGYYVQLGEASTSKAKGAKGTKGAAKAAKGAAKTAKGAKTGKSAAAKPRRASLLKHMKPHEITLKTALDLLSLPRELGQHPTSGEMILAGFGRYGPYLKHGASFVSLPADDDVLSIGINRAVTVIDEAKSRSGGRELGPHPDDGAPVTTGRGRYGHYVRHGRVYATIPRDLEPDDIDLGTALDLLSRKVARTGGATKTTAKKATAKKTTAKKGTARKSAAKKPSGRRRVAGTDMPTTSAG